MGKYTVIQGQNIYDVALKVYGSVEGITDLLVNNEWLSLNSDLKAGCELIFTDDYRLNEEVVAYYETHGITPASGEQHVYPKVFSLPLSMVLTVSNKEIGVGFTVSGDGTVEVDWGDNCPVQCVRLTNRATVVSHLFDSSVVAERKISLYMRASISLLDISDLRPVGLYMLRPVAIERFRLTGGRLSLESLPMLGGVFDVNLDGHTTFDLTPLVCLKNLMRLSLCGSVYPQPSIDAYLTGLVERHDNRRNCRVLLSTVPSGEYREPARGVNNRYILTCGMEAVWVLTHERAWNEGGAWEFVINETTYIYEQND